jgi:hypothetical protein
MFKNIKLKANNWEKQMDYGFQHPFISPSYFCVKEKIISEGNLSSKKYHLTKKVIYLKRRGAIGSVQKIVAIPNHFDGMSQLKRTSSPSTSA